MRGGPARPTCPEGRNVHEPSRATAAPAWPRGALCAEHPVDLWHPGRGETTDEALDICRRCPVRHDCLEHAIAHKERHGIWGGVGEKARDQLIAERHSGAPRATADRAAYMRRWRAANPRPASTECPRCGDAFPNPRAKSGHMRWCRQQGAA